MLEFLYHNRGNGSFEEVGLSSGIAADANGRTYAGMGVEFADFNNDELPDLVITNLAGQRYAMYQNAGDGTFTYVSDTSGVGRITQPHSGWGIALADVDNDGWKDLLIAQGHDLDTIELTFPNLHYREPMVLARNTGKVFEDISAQADQVFAEPWVARGLAIGDIDNDGRIDAVVTTNDGSPHVLHNETANPNHWLSLKLVGHRSNRDAVGAEVKLTTSKGPQFATLSTSGSYLSSKDKRVHFGLGNDVSAKSVEIHWPSGIVQTLNDVRGDQILVVDEPASSATGAKR